MAKKSRRAQSAGPRAGADVTDVPEVGLRQPCPCGSGKRYKQCHGRQQRQARFAPVTRPFQGLPGERDWVALRELVPAATASLTLRDEPDRSVLACSVLPFAAPAMVRGDGAIWLGLQREPARSDDPSRDLAASLREALAAEPNEVVGGDADPNGPRLQDLLDLDAAFDVEVQTDFAFWTEGDEEPAPEVVASRDRANEAAHPSARLAAVEAAYWCRIGDRWHLRWVMDHEEERLLDAFARLAARDSAGVGPGSRLVGSFRAHGLVVPVWDLAPETPVEDVEEPAAALEQRLGEALAEGGGLNSEERRARAGITSRQVTLH